ncbi:unnamed protein product [Cylicocyclus nassatus]|uniref:RNA helicase n=1 Tax=Cylicocyclus nassatus TaxID=53992 RepID=A0AA36M5C4_CYLNA|nr:unnamed protein product [Cylicocyclus nassatus]
MTSTDVLYDPKRDHLDTNDSNQLVIVPGKKRKKVDDGPIPKKKDATGGKKSKNYAKEREKQKMTKKMKRQLAAVQQRKANKLTQEELFASLAEYQVDTKKLNQLGSSTHMQEKLKGDDSCTFPTRIKSVSSKIKLPPTVHEKERKQENYYPTDDESSEEDKDEGDEIEGCQASISTSQPENEVPAETNEVADSNHEVEESVEKPAMSSADQNKTIVTGETAKQQELRVPPKEVKVEAEEEVSKPALPAVQRKRVLIARDPNMEAKRAQLPIYSEEVPIMETINDNVVTVICGETGSGKTTQIPQFLYEAGYANDGQLIGITEPRRVAAMSMAQRVGEELNAPDEVSYQIRYEGNRTDKTRILFMTDGVLMKEMESDIMLKKYSAILIDEAHERSMYSDVLIGMLSRIAPLRAKTANPLKLIIMSATLRLDDFTHKRLFPIIEPQVISVEARQFPVTVHFEKRTPADYMVASFRKICRIHEALPDGAILVFVSGQQEVKQLVKKLVARYPVHYEKSKDGELMVRGGKKWKKKRLKEVQDLKLEDFKENRVEQLDGEDFLETGVGDTMWDDYEEGEEDEDSRLETPMAAPPNDCAPLYCLPLYSLLSSEKQRRVFEPPPEGARMCVIATNVAETSLTIPGVKYVVDTGFEKRRLYDPITGVSQFVVAHISQASADQRAGRAGRIAPGHAYRLYSSAVFEDFEKFSRPEILDKPADQLVLHLKSMNIVKVVNFPFPSAPDPETLEAAELRLVKLGALAKTTKEGKTEARITSLGRTLSVFPLAPTYAKVIAMANQHSLMPYAILLIAALSVREPMIPISSIRGETDEETKEKMTEVLKMRRSWCGKGPGRRLGDLLVLMRAVNCSEAEKMSPAACSKLGLRHKAMLEIRRLRRQLTNIVNTSFKAAADVVFDPNLSPPSDTQAQMLRQMMVAGLADRIARRVDRSAGDEEVPKGAYQTMKLQEYVFIDPCSVIYTEEPDYVIYQEIVQLGDRKCMQNLMMVDHEWLTRLAEPYCNFAPMDKDQLPRYDAEKDQIVKSVNVTFGPLEWHLEPVDRPVPNDIMLYRYFAQFLLAGEVMPLLAEYVPKMLAPPTTMVRSWAKLQKRTETLLNALIEKEVHTKADLIEAWHKDENYLLEEYLEWLPESLHGTITVMWPPLEQKTAKMELSLHQHRKFSPYCE